jgi:quercetin dioxygenase-like cupin family protein
MPDPVPPVDLASLAAGGNHPGALWRLDEEDLQANLIWLGRGDRIESHRNDEVDVLVVVISGRGELTLDGQVHPLAPMILAHIPKGTVRALVAVDGRSAMCRSIVADRRDCSWVGRTSHAEIALKGHKTAMPWSDLFCVSKQQGSAVLTAVVAGRPRPWTVKLSGLLAFS